MVNVFITSRGAKIEEGWGFKTPALLEITVSSSTAAETIVEFAIDGPHADWPKTTIGEIRQWLADRDRPIAPHASAEEIAAISQPMIPPSPGDNADPASIVMSSDAASSGPSSGE